MGDAYTILLEHLDPDTARDTGFWRDEDSDSDNEFYAYERMDFYMYTRFASMIDLSLTTILQVPFRGAVPQKSQQDISRRVIHVARPIAH